MATRKRYSDEFKVEAVRLWQTSDKSAREIETDLGLSAGILYKWHEKLGREPGTDEGRRDQEVRRLQRELERVQQERDILKKAVAIFSQVQP